MLYIISRRTFKMQNNLLTTGLCVFFMVVPLYGQENAEVSKIETFYYDKCLKNTRSADTFNKLRTDTYEMYKYFEYAFQFLPGQKELFCKSERPQLLSRIKEVANDLKPCLSPEEKYLSGFIKESFTELLHFFCHNDGEYTRRFFNTEGSECRKKIEESKTNDLENCLGRIFAPTRDFLTKKEMCDDMTVARKCFNQLVDVYCPTSYNTRRLSDKFFDFVSKPCSGCVHSISTILLLSTLLVHYFFNKF